MNFTRKISTIIFIVILICSFLTCRKDTSPIVNPPDEPDTTSHEFQWDYEIIDSPYSGGVLSDVAIIDENDIWAVGEIYADSIQPHLLYNAVHWDGNRWESMRIQIFYNGSYITPPLQGIFAISENDIWVTSGVPKHWNGNTWTQFHLWDMGILTQEDGGVIKIWGSSPEDLYFVGRSGTIVRYNNNTWRKLESGTDIAISDIWGAQNPDTGEEEILAVASNGPFLPLEKKILRIQDMTVTSLPDSGLSDVLSSIWFIPNWRYFVVGSGVFYNSQLGDVWTRNTTMPSLYTYSIRGSDWNNVFIVGAHGLVLHYNGESWRHYNKGEVPGFYGIYNAVAVKEDLVVAVGDINAEKGIILIGRRLE
jgi:hypothetical protein